MSDKRNRITCKEKYDHNDHTFYRRVDDSILNDTTKCDMIEGRRSFLFPGLNGRSHQLGDRARFLFGKN